MHRSIYTMISSLWLDRGKRFFLIITPVIFFIFMPLPGCGDASNNDERHGTKILFPFIKGTVWEYSGVVIWTDTASGKIMTDSIHWRSQIIGLLRYKSFSAAVLRGHPQDLAWYELNRVPQKYLYVTNGNGKYFFLRDIQADTVQTLFDKSSEMIEEFLPESDLVVELPLGINKLVGEKMMIDREDGMYCWQLTDSSEYTPPSEIRKPENFEKEYQYTYRSFADVTTISYVKGIGLTAFKYHHNGTVSETNVRLIRIKNMSR